MVFKEVARLIGGVGGRAITGTCNCALIGEEEGRKEDRRGRETGNVYVVCLQAGIDG